MNTFTQSPNRSHGRFSALEVKLHLLTTPLPTMEMESNRTVNGGTTYTLADYATVDDHDDDLTET
ncbi:hypothetical protein J6590_043610 [Homalodisca vitripennis]|nr:hypothetical protein J6590_043610 [Homalodisca vitripennis]